ncbi:hypothetical protein niasHT_016272 [Heterodera trifolii]|uniref:Uncharacterized protein n=1 Tax=Heterodera trifolii TaxID=157864 RepID=A0ABD2LHQ5_9BILA
MASFVPSAVSGHYPGWRGRFPSSHKRRSEPECSVKELIRMNPLHLFFLGFVPPFLGAIGSIVTALLLHNDEISNYNWQCGRARLPSLSRIINLPMERIFWQITFLFHIPLRAVEIAVGFFRYGRLRSVNCNWPRLYSLCRHFYLWLGSLELIFLIALSVVGEREFISYHVIFFYAFGAFAIGFFLTNVICHSQSLYYLNPYGRISYHFKIVVTILYVISVPVLFGAFVLYWRKCITIMYDVFAVAEYIDVFLTIAYHCCAFFDIRYKVIFSWCKFKRGGLFEMFFVEEKREKLRIQKKRTKLADIFLHSSSDDYYALRLLYNLPVGFGIALLIYHLAWYRINFADSILINPFWKDFVKWLMIVSSALSYTLNPLVRASLGCALFASLGSTGQGLLSVFVVENLNKGPIENIIQNFNISTMITVCHLQLQARITKSRMELQAGPIEALFEKNFGKVTTIGNKVVHTLKSLLQPFDDDIEEDSEEDSHLAAIIDTAQKIADRQLLTEGEDPSVGTMDRAAKPAWKRLKSQLGRAIVRRFERRCKYIFASSVESCHKRLQQSQSLCYDAIPWPLDSFACSRINALSLCQAKKVGEMSVKFCELGKSTDSGKEEHEMLFTPELDGQMYGLQNVSKQIERQLQLNLHFQAVEQPEIERGYSTSQLHNELEHDVKILQVFLGSFSLVLDFVVVLLTYLLFKNCVQTTLCYLNDIEFQNFFTTPYFWRIDSKRNEMGKVFLGKLRKPEKKHNKVISPYGLPHSEERKKMVSSSVRLSVLVFVVIIVIVVDHFFFKMLQIVVIHGKTIRSQQGGASLNIVVNGSGAVAELLRKVLQFEYAENITKHLDNLHCLSQPSAPNWTFNTWYLMVPLPVMFLLQVFLNFIVQRFVLFFVLGLMFPRRAKARIIHLYNKMLFGRVNSDKLSAAKKNENEGQMSKDGTD